MNPAAVLLTELRRRGVILIAAGDRLRVEAPPGALTQDLRVALVEQKAELLRLLGPPGGPAPRSMPVTELREALRSWYAMVAREADGNVPISQEARMLLSEIRRLWDEVGPTVAEAVERREARAYDRETGRCPYCGEPAIFHDPERGGEPA